MHLSGGPRWVAEHFAGVPDSRETLLTTGSCCWETFIKQVLTWGVHLITPQRDTKTVSQMETTTANGIRQPNGDMIFDGNSGPLRARAENFCPELAGASHWVKTTTSGPRQMTCLRLVHIADMGVAQILRARVAQALPHSFRGSESF